MRTSALKMISAIVRKSGSDTQRTTVGVRIASMTQSSSRFSDKKWKGPITTFVSRYGSTKFYKLQQNTNPVRILPTSLLDQHDSHRLPERLSFSTYTRGNKDAVSKYIIQSQRKMLQNDAAAIGSTSSNLLSSCLSISNEEKIFNPLLHPLAGKEDPEICTVPQTTRLLSGLHNRTDSIMVWKEACNDFVFSYPGNERSNKFTEIPMMHLLQTTIFRQNQGTRYFPSRLQSACLLPNSMFSYNTHHHDSSYRNNTHYFPRHQFEYLQNQNVSFFSTDSTEQKREATTSTSPSPSSSTGTKPISLTLGKTQIPTPSSALPIQSNPLETLKAATPKGILHKGMDITISIFRTILSFLLHLPGNTYYYITHPKELQESIHKIRKTVMDELHHYWVGTKLLWADIQTAQSLLKKTLNGSSLSRRERRQLLRTVSDLFRLIPFSMFIIIPFMEFALPIALRIFPNLLPSTYQDKLKAEEDMKRELKSRIAMAQFFQETLEELAKEQKQKASKKKEELEEAGVSEDIISNQKDSAASMLEFLAKARRGEMIPPDAIIRYAKYFHDDLTLDNMPRMQLINMCRYMGIPPYGNDNFLQFQLRMRIRSLKEDDQRILWEGIDSLTKMELREACQERGMRSTGLSKEAYKANLQQWLDLSVNKDVPISLLIMSRTFLLREEMFEGQMDGDSSKSITGLADAISGLDKEIVNEVILEVATQQEKISNPDVTKIKLEIISAQNELIKEEEKAREEAAKIKEAAEKEKTAKKLMAADVEVSNEEMPLSTTELPKTVVRSSKEEAATAPNVDVAVTRASHGAESKASTKEEKIAASADDTLSTEEMDAITQLISNNSPVSAERAELEKIKAAMKDKSVKEREKIFVDEVIRMVADEKIAPAESVPVEHVSYPTTPQEADQFVKDSIEKLDAQISAATDIGTKVSFEEKVPPVVADSEPVSINVPEVKEEDVDVDDPIVARLKQRVASMVGKIEAQLSETEVKIGDKLRILDQDGDGILSLEEMATSLQFVLKRGLTFEQAMVIAEEIDKNHDGVFTIAELKSWCDEKKLERFLEEGRHDEMRRIIENDSKEETTTATTQPPLPVSSATTNAVPVSEKVQI